MSLPVCRSTQVNRGTALPSMGGNGDAAITITNCKLGRKMRIALFWAITQREVVIPYQKSPVFICFASEAWNHTWEGSNQDLSPSVCSLKCSSFCSFTKRKTVGKNGSIKEMEVPAATTTVAPPWSLKPLISLIVTSRCLAQPSFVVCRVLFILPLCNYINDTRLVQVLFSFPLHLTCCLSQQ
jgi:hypothetical protein